MEISDINRNEGGVCDILQLVPVPLHIGPEEGGHHTGDSVSVEHSIVVFVCLAHVGKMTNYHK